MTEPGRLRYDPHAPKGRFNFGIYGEAMDIMRQNMLLYAAFGLISVIIIFTAGQFGSFGNFFMMSGASNHVPMTVVYLIMAIGGIVGITFQITAMFTTMVGTGMLVRSQLNGHALDLAEGFQAYRKVFQIAVTTSPLIIAFLPNTLISVGLMNEMQNMDQRNPDLDKIFQLFFGMLGFTAVSLVIGLVVYSLFTIAPFLVAFKDITPGQALAQSFQYSKRNILGLCGMSILNTFIYTLGFMCCCVGAVFALPYISIVTLLAFRDLAHFPLVHVASVPGYSPYPRSETGEMPPAPPKEPPR